MDKTYPIIKIPLFLKQPNLFLENIEDPIEPTVPKEPHFKSSFPWLIIIYTLLGMPLLSVALGIPGFIIAIILLIVISVNHTSKEELRNYERLERHEKDVHYYESRLEEYYKMLEIKRKRDIELEVLNKDPMLRMLKIWTTRIEYLETSTPPSERNLQASKGISEPFFFSFLKSHFGEMIITDKSLDGYTPDFIFYDPLFSLYIDIEIDEPYDYRTKEPTHSIGSDDARDNYFLSKKWCVVRFSEKQVFEHPNECCDEIKRTINKIFLTVYKSEDIKGRLITDQRWTISEAKKFIKIGYRDSYIIKIK